MSLFRRSTSLAGAQDFDGRGRRSSTGPRVTSDTALRQSVVWGATRLRADLLSLMPVDVYRKVAGAGINVEVAPPPVLVEPSTLADGHPMTIGEWLYAGQMSLDRVGNNVGVITKLDAFGLPAAIDLVAMDEVRIRIKDHRVHQYYVNGEKVDSRLIWHERQHVTAGIPVGLSPIAYAALNLAGAEAAQQFAVDWFVNGTVPSAILKNGEKVLTPEAAAIAGRRFEAAVQNGRPFVTGKDWTYDPIAAKASESAFIEQMQYSDVALCRFMGVPADLVDVAVQSSTLSYANITQRNLQLLVMNLGSVVKRRNEALGRLTPKPRFVKLNSDAILAMDAKTRAELFELQIRNRMRTPDQVRAIEDQMPLSEEDYAQFERLWPTSRPGQQQISGGN